MAALARWIGLDTSIDTVAICILSKPGRVLGEHTAPCTASAITSCLQRYRLSPEAILGVEAGSTGTQVTRDLRSLGYHIEVLETQNVSAFLSVRQNKSDRNDARGIADALRLGEGVVPRVHLKGLACQHIRSAIVLRHQLVGQRVALENAIGALLRLNGGRLRNVWSATSLRRNAESELERLRSLGADIRDIASPCLDLAVRLRQLIEQMDKRLERSAREDDVCRRLMTVPGVGWLCALSFYTAIECPDRFAKAEDVAPYFGLVPKLHESGQVSRLGHISKRGSRFTRTHLVTAAQSLLRQSGDESVLRQWALAIQARAGRSKARVALARKIAIVLLALWKSGEAFDAHGRRGPAAVPRSSGLLGLV
jgi:transposase